MNRLGMLVDVSHASDETFADVMAVSTAPVIASHSGARALADHPRNLTDEQIRAIARSGGVVQVNFYPRFLEARIREAMDEVEARLDAEVAAERARGVEVTNARIEARRRAMIAAIPPTPLSVLVDHIEHVIRVGGIDHVGIGSDFDGIAAVPAGMEDVTALPRIAQALLDRGHAEEEIGKVLGGNMLRVMGG
jgi:membrane dipeptidase